MLFYFLLFISFTSTSVNSDTFTLRFDSTPSAASIRHENIAGIL